MESMVLTQTYLLQTSEQMEIIHFLVKIVDSRQQNREVLPIR